MNPLTTEQAVDSVFFYIFGIAIIMLVGITVTMLIFIVRYRKSKHPHPEASPHSSFWLEATWTVLPTLIVLTMFWYGWEGYTTLTNVPPDAMKVEVIGRQWSWEFRYPNGRSSEKLMVPVDKAIVLDITSEDVIHSFYVPAFRVKKDAVPGMHTHLWFRAPAAGSYDAFCAEYCGVGHAAMITTVEALPEHQFQEWYQGETAQEESGEGQKLLSKYGCLGCHSTDGSAKVGPTFKGLFGRQVTVVTDGKEHTLTVDEAYIRRSIENPNADIVKGFPAVMPSFKDKIPDHDLQEIIESFHRAAVGGKTGNLGEKLFTEQGCSGCHSRDGSNRVGPTLKGVFGRQVTVTRKGKEITLTADEDYLKESITHPERDVVKGFSPIMPPFNSLNDEQVEQLVDYMKTLK